eukprot:CAMPEP_0182862602 /NCGR_PEP_ID=MMETSP0034_2-20130328/6162_1 /TAXON_ID=156128 /ORGANISM="Nephroselmis pyriformis, Strain CCMP717" /LENGTH=448 /DNA_ID=CAMNT_0024994689 /DNA_START=65 /DNA_END=1408 /DNA_ORIENTATION=+
MPTNPTTPPAREDTTTSNTTAYRRKTQPTTAGEAPSVSGRRAVMYSPPQTGSAQYQATEGGLSEVGTEVLMEMGLLPAPHEKLLVDTCRRVRELEAALENEEKRVKNKIEDLQAKVKRLGNENQALKNKYHTEKDAAAFHSEDAKRKDELLAQVVEENTRLRSKLVGLNQQNIEGWGQVGIKNLKLQELRRQAMKMTKDYEKEKVARIQVERERDAVALRIKPIKQKNLEIQYRLRLEVEKNGGVRDRMVEVAEELQEERRYMERLASEAQMATQDMASAMEEGSRMQLQVQQLFDHNQVLSTSLAREEDERAELEHTLEETQGALEEQHAANESLQEAFLAEQSARSGLQTALDAEVEENCRLQAVAGELQGALEDEVGMRSELETRAGEMGAELRDLRKHTPLIKGVYHTAKHKGHLQLSKLQSELRGLAEGGLAPPGHRTLRSTD